MVNAALMDGETSNYWAVSYISSLLVDFCIISILASALKVSLFNKSIGRSGALWTFIRNYLA